MASDDFMNAPSQSDSLAQLRESERRYRELFNVLPFAVWEQDASNLLKSLRHMKATGVSELDTWLDENPAFIDEMLAQLTVVNANQAARTLHGVHDAESSSVAQVRLSMAGAPRFRAAMRMMLLAVWEDRSYLEISYSITRPNHTKAEVLARLLLPEPGNERLLWTELDVTEQRRAEERFRQVALASSDLIFDRDLASDVTWVNDAAAWHPECFRGVHEVPRSIWVDSIHPDDNDQILAQIETAISTGQTSWEGEYRLRRRDGKYVPVRERASILRDDSGHPVRMLGNIIDLSAQRALEAQLRQSQRMDAVGQLTGGIAHDFNNLLTVILGNAEALAELFPADAPGATMAQQIVTVSERAASLTQYMLAFARKQPLSPGFCDANRIIEEMQVMIERSITPAITLELSLNEVSGAVHVDRALFQSAVLNLCVNARQAMPEGGTLRVETSAITVPTSTDPDAPPAGEYVHIAVSDTGTGMDKETLAQVFEPFFTTKSPGEGSGLGLSMVHGFVHQSGGHVRIQSRLGQGSTVDLFLPRHARDADEPPAQRSPDAAPRQSAKRARILVVDDEDHVRAYVCRVVRSLGYEAEAEPLPANALARLRAKEPFDLLISDIVMPGGISGRQLAELVLKERSDLPVLLVSGHSGGDDSIEGEFDARISFLRKPFRKKKLAEMLARLLSG